MKSTPIIIKKVAFYQLGQVIPKSWPAVRNAAAFMYNNMRKTPIGADLSRLIYDNAEAIPHLAITQPIPGYPNVILTGAYALLVSKNKKAEARTVMSLLRHGVDTAKDLIDDAASTGMAIGNYQGGL